MTKTKPTVPIKRDLIIATLIILALYLAAISLPINSKAKDIYLDITVEQPLIPDLSFQRPNLKITNIDATVKDATFLTAPEFLGFLGIAESGKIKLVSYTTSKKDTITADPITVTTSTTLRSVINAVPLSEKTITITLYDNNKLVQTETLELP